MEADTTLKWRETCKKVGPLYCSVVLRTVLLSQMQSVPVIEVSVSFSAGLGPRCDKQYLSP